MKNKQKEIVIDKKSEYRILSNFVPTPFVLDGKRYASVEGFWQSLKYPEPDDEKRMGDRMEMDERRSC